MWELRYVRYPVQKNNYLTALKLANLTRESPVQINYDLENHNFKYTILLILFQWNCCKQHVQLVKTKTFWIIFRNYIPHLFCNIKSFDIAKLYRSNLLMRWFSHAKTMNSKWNLWSPRGKSCQVETSSDPER